MDPVERQHHNSRLPVELYRLIVSEVKDRPVLVCLLTVSRAFCYEAERILYRNIHIDLVDGTDSRKLPLQSMSCRRRCAYHVHSLGVNISGNSNLVMQILKSSPNLKSLSIDCQRAEKTIKLPQKPPFQLLKLETDSPGDSGFKAFLETQRELTTLEWNPSSIDIDLFCPMDFLPSVRNIISSKECIGWVIPDTGIQRISFDDTIESLIYSLGSDIPVKSIRSLVVTCEFEDITSLDDIFPNLEYLEGLRFPLSLRDIVITKFTHLKKIRLIQFHHDPPLEHDQCAALASRLFRSLATLESIEIRRFLAGKAWTLQRGADPTLVEERHLVEDEWIKW